MLVDLIAIPNATGPANAPARAASSATGASFADTLASTNAAPADAAANPSYASDRAASGTAPESSSSAVSLSAASGVAANSNSGNQVMPGAPPNINAGSKFTGESVSASSLISKFAAKTSSRAGGNSGKTTAPALTATSNPQSGPAAIVSWLAQPVVAAPQLAFDQGSLGANLVLPAGPPSSAPAEIAAAASPILSTEAIAGSDADVSATTSASAIVGAIPTVLTPQTASTVSPPLQQDASVPQTIPLQVGWQPQNDSSTEITSPIQVTSQRLSSAILSSMLPASARQASATQVSALSASPNSAAEKIFASAAEAVPSLAPDAPAAIAPVAANSAEAAITAETAGVTNPGAANISGLTDNELPDNGFPASAPNSQSGSASPASAPTLPIPASAAASVAGAASPAPIPTSVSTAASAVVPATSGPAASGPAPSRSVVPTVIPALHVEEPLNIREHIAPIISPVVIPRAVISRSVVPAKTGLTPTSSANETARTVTLRDLDKSFLSISAKGAVADELVSTDAAVPGPSPVSAYGYPGELLSASSESSSSATATSASDTQGSSGAASLATSSASDSRAPASSAADTTDPSAAIPSASLPNGPKSFAAASLASLQSSLTFSTAPATTHDAGNNAPVAVPLPVPSAAGLAVPEKSSAPPELPLAHQMLDSAPVPSANDPALASPGAHLPSGPAALQMHLGVHTDAFGSIEIHTVVEQSQVGVAIHGDRDLARWFNSEIGGLETGLKGQHLNLTGVDFSSNRSGVQTATSFQQGQPRQNLSQNEGPHAAAPSADMKEAEPVNESNFDVALPFQGMQTRVSILA